MGQLHFYSYNNFIKILLFLYLVQNELKLSQTSPGKVLIDAIITVTKLPDIVRFLNFTQAYLMTPMVVITRKDTPTLKSIKDVI